MTRVVTVFASDRREAAEETSVAGIVISIVFVTAIIGFVFFMLYDRTPPGSTAISEPSVSAPHTQTKTIGPPPKTRLSATPTPSRRLVTAIRLAP